MGKHYHQDRMTEELEHMDDVNYHFLSRNQYCVFGKQGCHETAFNVYETEDTILVVADLAGVDPNSFVLEVSSNKVVIRGNRCVEPPENLLRIDRLEISAGPFELDVPLRVPVDANQATSHYHNGLLHIEIPLVKPPSQRIIINVQQEGDPQ